MTDEKKDGPDTEPAARGHIDDHLRRAFVELESDVPDKLFRLLEELKAGEQTAASDAQAAERSRAPSMTKGRQ